MKRSSAHFKAGSTRKKISKTKSERDRFKQRSSSDSSSDTEDGSINFGFESSTSTQSDDYQLNSICVYNQVIPSFKTETSVRYTNRESKFSDIEDQSSEIENSDTRLNSDDDGRFETSASSICPENSDFSTSDDDSTIILSNSETDIDSDSSLEDEKPNLAKDLSYFVAVSGTRQRYTNLLLNILHKNEITNIPKSYQTLMKTPKQKIDQKPAEYGHYFHYKSLTQWIVMYESLLKDVDEIEIDIGVDGFKPFKATALDIWPVMGAISNSVRMPPFLIGCYAGHKSPKNPDILLADLCSDMENLNENGVYFPSSGRTVTVRVRLFIMDAPARAMICGIKSHASYEGCPLCVMNERIYSDAVNYTSSIGNISRNDQKFASRMHPAHHRQRFLKELSLLERNNIRMVSQFPIEPMHAIELGVSKKTLKLLKLKKTGNEINIDAISGRMINFKHYRPSDFARDCRSLQYLQYFKATELRMFLFYGCIVFLKGLVDDYIYHHWLLLHCAVRLMSNDSVQRKEVDLAEELLVEYVRLFPIIYGEENVTYNVHVLLHIPFFVILYGPLDNFSMFKFENFIQLLKKLIRKADRPLQQIYNRLEELSKVHDGPVESNKFDSFDIRDNEKDSFIAIKYQRDIIPVRFLRFTEANDMKYVKVLRCLNTSCFYSWPIASNLLGEISYERLSTIEETFLATDIHYKYCRIPYENLFVLIPILHTMSLKFDYNDSI